MVATRNAKPVDPSLVPIDSGVESWKNVTAGIVVINKVGEYGRPLHELVQSGRVFTLTPQERRLNQDACASEDMDFFRNGTLQPVRLLDDEPDTAALLANPNAISDDELPSVFKLKGENLRDRLAQISNLTAATRLVELARKPEFNVTLEQFDLIKARERELQKVPSDGTIPLSPERVIEPPPERKTRGVTPR